MIRFLHAADLHLDSPMHGLQAYEGAPKEELRGATRRAFDNLVQLALDEKVQFVLLAGDLYDGDWPDANTGLYFINGMHKLNDAGISAVLISGNHDAANKITTRLTYPGNVYVLSTDQPETHRIEALRVAVHGRGYPHQEERRNLASTYPVAVPGWYNVGLLHSALEGREGHANYAPCTVPELKALGYDYWALGHIHERESVHGDEPPRIEFPGCIQGRSVRECGAKGCLIVTVDDAHRADIEFHALDVVRWAVVRVEAAAESDRNAVRRLAVAAIEQALHEADSRLLAVRAIVTVNAGVLPQMADFRADLCGAFPEGVWIEKVKLHQQTEARALDAALSEDAASELRAVLADLQAEPGGLTATVLAGDCGKLTGILPKDVMPDWNESLDEIREQAEAFLFASAAEVE